MLCTSDYNINPCYPHIHNPHEFSTPVPQYYRPLSPKHRFLEEEQSTFLRRTRTPYNLVHNQKPADSSGLLKNDKHSPSNNWPMQQKDPRRRILEELQYSPKSTPSISDSRRGSLPVSPSSISVPEGRRGSLPNPSSISISEGKRPSLRRNVSEMPYREPDEEVAERPRRHRHEHSHHHHHHHRSPEDKHTSSSMDDSSDDRTPSKSQPQRPPMVRRSKTSGGSFASALFKRKVKEVKEVEPRRSVDREVERPRAERRDSTRNYRELLRERDADRKRGSRESSVNPEYAKHKEPKGYAVHRENSMPVRKEESREAGIRRAKTHHHRDREDREERHRSGSDRRSGEEKSKPKRSDREEKVRSSSKSRDAEKAKEKARVEAHKRKHRQNVLSEILIHEQRLLAEQNLPPNRTPPQPPKLVECNTCLSDDIPEDQAAKLACGHTFCNDCLVRLFNLSLTDPAHMPPRCCQPDSHIPLKHVDKLLSTKTKIKWNKKYQEYTTANRMYCPEVDCGEWIKPQDFYVVDGTKVGKCSRCKTVVCSLCGLKEHGKEECPNDEELNNVREMGKELGWQRCYNCRAMVELEKGCNHMTCRCTAEFCMICAAKWKTCSCPWFNFEPGEDDLPVPQFDENGRLQDEDLAWEDRGRQNDEDERLARQLALDFEEMDNRRDRNNGGGFNMWAPMIVGAIGGLLSRTRNLEGVAMERLRRAYANALEDDFGGWGDSSSESEDEHDNNRNFWNVNRPHAIHI